MQEESVESTTARAQELVQKAQEILARFIYLSLTNNRYADALTHFEEAIELYESNEEHENAGDTCLLSVVCHEKLFPEKLFEVYSRAAKHFAHVPALINNKYMTCKQRAISLCLEDDKILKAAQLSQQLALTCEQNNMLGESAKAYQLAADYFMLSVTSGTDSAINNVLTPPQEEMDNVATDDDDKRSSISELTDDEYEVSETYRTKSYGCIVRMAEIQAIQHRYAEAIEALESIPIDTSVALILCKLLKDKSADELQSLVTEEHEYIIDLIVAVKENNLRNVENLVKNNQSPNPWVSRMFRRVQKLMNEKNGIIDPDFQSDIEL